MTMNSFEGKHTPISKILSQNPHAREYFKFSFVRNPWDRAVSTYIFLSLQPKHNHRINPSKTSFLEWTRTLKGKSGNPFYSQWYWLSYQGKLAVDFVGRFEVLGQDFQRIADLLSLGPVRLPNINRTGHKHYTEFYVEESRQNIAEVYRRDIEVFGYKFGGFTGR